MKKVIGGFLLGSAAGGYGVYHFADKWLAKKNESIFKQEYYLDGLPTEYDYATCRGTDIRLISGETRTIKQIALEMGSDFLQNFAPINRIHMYLHAPHIYSGYNLDRQISAHHFCSHLNEDFAQCVIYDSDQPDAKLIGIEYVISEKLFKQLPDEEKKLWHSHNYEVKTGIFVAPGVPDAVEKTFMKDLATTYGKTVHCWQRDRGDDLPYGIPQIMMNFQKDGQVNPAIIAERDKHFGIDSKKKGEMRKDLPTQDVDPLADYWMKTGKSIQVKAVLMDMPPDGVTQPFPKKPF